MRQSRAWGRRAYDLNPAASSARHPPQPTRRPNPPGGQTIRNPPYCPKVSRGNRSPTSAFWPLAPIGRTPHLDTTSQSTPPEYGLTLRPSRSTGTQNGRNLPPCRRMANHDRSTRFNMKKMVGKCQAVAAWHFPTISQPKLRKRVESPMGPTDNHYSSRHRNQLRTAH